MNEKYKNAKLGTFIVGKKGCGRCVAYGPRRVVYEQTFNREKKLVNEPWEDVFVSAETAAVPPPFQGGECDHDWRKDRFQTIRDVRKETCSKCKKRRKKGMRHG